MTILEAIRQHKLKEVAVARREIPLERLEGACAGLEPARGLARAIRAGRPPDAPRATDRPPRLIAEIKRASPSAGVIRADFDPSAIAGRYAACGAAAISVLTDEHYFQGNLGYLRLVRARTTLPILRKDFMIDPYQVWEARAAGADAILIIAGLNPPDLQQEIRDAARRAGLDALVEIHGEPELEEALALEPDLLGINNRDLRGPELRTRLETTERLVPLVPPEMTLVSESGIRDRSDVEALRKLGIDGILVGEHLMREPDPGAAISDRLGIE